MTAQQLVRKANGSGMVVTPAALAGCGRGHHGDDRGILRVDWKET